MQPRGRKSERGNSVLEFALVAMPLVTMLLGVVVVGLNLGRSVQCSQVCRDTGSMYVRGVDFSRDGNKDILVRMAQGLGITRTGGTGVIILSKVTWVPASQCTALSLSPCNSNRHVVTQRIVIGNQALRASALGTPNSGLIDSSGIVSNYMQEGSAVANLVGLQLSQNEFAYVAESYFSSPDYDLPGFQSGSGVYSRSIF